uniref:Uncharacterized protein n=1 Tax=Cacopsylla melanoneura TaxID=428564 RepID=A0A8D8R2X6_9HEMI
MKILRRKEELCVRKMRKSQQSIFRPVKRVTSMIQVVSQLSAGQTRRMAVVWSKSDVPHLFLPFCVFLSTTFQAQNLFAEKPSGGAARRLRTALPNPIEAKEYRAQLPTWFGSIRPARPALGHPKWPHPSYARSF